jgi:hypothetical protein
MNEWNGMEWKGMEWNGMEKSGTKKFNSLRPSAGHVACAWHEVGV